MASHAMSEKELCPLDSRRTTTELVVKLFIVHFTTISAYCHLLSIRGEPIIGWRLVFYILEPFSLFGHYALSTTVLFAALVLYLVKPNRRHRDVLVSVAPTLFGNMSKQQEQTLPLVGSRRSSNPQRRL